MSGLLLVNGLLLLPEWLSVAFTDAGIPALLAAESALLVGVTAFLPAQRWGRAVAWTLAAGVVAVSLLATADLVFRVSLGRSLNLFVDLYLLRSLYDLAVGNSGLPTTLALGSATLLALVLSTAAAGLLLRPPSPAGPRRIGAALLGLGALGLIAEAVPGARERVDTPVARLAATQARQLRETLGAQARFDAEMASAPASYADLPGLLAGLEGRDVFIAFLESYGMAALEDPEFAELIRPRLEALATSVERAGLHLATGEMVSPTTGGQSWYAHGTVLSGLWLESQPRYDLLMRSERETLVDDFAHADYRTAVVMPAITMGWPDGVRLGYDNVYTRPKIPYAGPPLYWVTMPDQFTWSFLHRAVRPSAEGQPLFVEVGMVSSHAPWTPVLPMVDWDSIGDGSAFAPWEQQGHPPEELWVDIGELRRGYARSLDYALQAMAGFAERYVDDRLLLIVFGDHQAAPWVTGSSSPNVPVHVIASDPALVRPFVEWGFRPGAFPDPGGRTHRMDAFRDWFVHAFSRAPAAREHPSEEGS